MQNKPTTSSEFAVYYADVLGWAVFPAPNDGTKKSLLSSEYSGGRKWGASKSPDEIRATFAMPRCANGNVGIACGESSDIFVLDVDTPEGHDVDGFANLAALEVKHGKLPDTLQAESPGGSVHYYFRWPGYPIKSSASKIAKGVDIRGDGGMVLAPPSVKQGKPGAYRWRNSVRVADAPQWLLQLVKATPKQYRTVGVAREAPAGLRPPVGSRVALFLKSACEKVAAAEGGKRNDELNRQASFVGRYVGSGEIGLDVAAFDLLAACSDNGLLADDGEQQCKATIRSGLTKGRSEPASDPFAGMMQPASPTATVPAVSTPMVGGSTAAIVDLGMPRIAQFNAAHTDIAHDPEADPLLPHDMHAADLRGPLTEAVGKVLTLAKTQRYALQFETIRPVIAVLAAAHEMAYDAVVARVRATGARLADGNLKNAVRGFEGDILQATRSARGWVTNSKHQPDSQVSENVDVLLSLLNTELRYNEFSRCVEFRRNGEPWGELLDDDISSIHYEANSAAHRFHISEKFLDMCVGTIARRRCYDPLIDYLNQLKWDGVARLDSWIPASCGVPAEAYHGAVGRSVIGGMVKRARQPGAKHDEVMLLIGEQGVTKSGLAKALVPDSNWFADSLNLKRNLGDLIPEISGKWLIEWAELTGKGKAEIEDIKAFISRATDRYTKKFKNLAGDYPRRMVFVATSNDDAPLRDESGNRRFLPVRVAREIDIAWIEANRDQLFAEADALYAQGERFGIPRELWDTACEHQEAARETPLYEDFIAEWFGGRQGHYYVTSTDLIAALHRKGIRGKPKVGAACKRVGLTEERPTINKQRGRVWITKGAAPDTAARATLNDLRLGEPHSKVEWKWPLPPPP